MGNNGSFTENEFNKGIIWYWKIQSSELGDTNHNIISSCDCIRVISLKKKYSNLKFSFNNLISSIMSCHKTVKPDLRFLIWKCPFNSQFEINTTKKKKLCWMEYFYSAWSLVLTGMFQLHIWFTLNFVLSIKRINSIPKSHKLENFQFLL